MSQLVLNGSLKEFFKLLVGEVVRRQRVSLEEVTEFYLVNLLAEYAEAEKLFTQELDGRRETEPLAILYHRALQQDRDEKIRTLRRLGDVSLYTAGFFQQSLADRVVGPDYYMQMGRTAYGAVAELAGPTAFASVYQELHQKFTALVEVLEEIAARGQCASGPEGQMRVFETWSRTGNERLKFVLADVGMIPGSKLLN
ncbi:MAG: hypothetical protein AB1938_01950 [Myxococcota bacterium]